MSLVIQKYGGSSLASSERIEKIAEHIAYTKANHFSQIVVVVSAMGNTTDELLSMAKNISNSAPSRELDMLLTAGERITMSLLAIALHKQGISSISLTGSQSGIITDNCHGNAKIQTILGHRIENALQQAHVVIVAGFQGMSLPEKEITTLGRGGSDLTAIALADRLKADACQIYKDVDGICSADPRVVESAKVLPSLSWKSLSTLTWAGSGVIHSRGAHLAEKRQIKLEIRSSFKFQQRGTIVQDQESLESSEIDAIAHLDNLSWIRLGSRFANMQALVNQWLWKQGISPLVQQQWQIKQNYCYQFCIPLDLMDKMKEWSHQQELKLEVCEQNLAAISLVGRGFKQDPSFLTKIAAALEQKRLVYQECQSHQIVFLVESASLKDAINELHTQLVVNKENN